MFRRLCWSAPVLVFGLCACSRAPAPSLAEFFNTGTGPDSGAIFVYSMEFVPTPRGDEQPTGRKEKRGEQPRAQGKQSKSAGSRRAVDVPPEEEDAGRQLQLEDLAINKLEHRLALTDYCPAGYTISSIHHGKKYISIKGHCTD